MGKESPKKGTKRSSRLSAVKKEDEAVRMPATQRFHEIKAKQHQRMVEENKRKVREKKAAVEETKRRQAIREHEMYKEINGKLQEKLREQGKLKTKYRLVSLSANEIQKLKEELDEAREKFFKQEESEKIDDWNKRSEKIQKQDWNGEFKTQRVICSTKRRINSELETDYLLVKFDEFPRASFSRIEWVNIPHQEDFRIRQLQLDLVEFNIRHTRGDAYFKLHFPNRYAELEENMAKGKDNCADKYIYSEKNRYKVFLMKMEEYFNAINTRYGLPPVFIEDWTAYTDWNEALQALKELHYVQSNIISDKVQALVDLHKDELAHIKCGASCKGSEKGCKDAKEPRRLCCGKKTTMELDESGKLVWKTGIEGKMPDSNKPECKVHIECTRACECDETCGNHRMQYGRQHPLLIFRSPEVGWTIRALTEIDKEEFVAEYTGNLYTEASPKDNGLNYDFPIAHSTTDKDGKEAKITVAGFKAGNETRFFSHSCNPSIASEHFMTERHGIFMSRVGFVTDRKLAIGDELSFDYFDKAGAINVVDVEVIFDDCKCNSAACRFTKKQIEAARKMEAEVKAEENELKELEKEMKDEFDLQQQQRRKKNDLFFPEDLDEKSKSPSVPEVCEPKEEASLNLSGRRKRASMSTDMNRANAGASTSSCKRSARRSGSDNENADRADPSHSGSSDAHENDKAKKLKVEARPFKRISEAGSSNEMNMDELPSKRNSRMSTSSSSSSSSRNRQKREPMQSMNEDD